MTDSSRLELWRIDPPTLLTWFLVPPDQGFAYMPPRRPAGWPRGYEWRCFDSSGREMERWSTDWTEP